MKFVVQCLVLLCLLSNVNAQNVKWDSTYRPASYDLRLAQFRSFPNSNKDIIFLGNSITAGAEWQELLENSNVRNRGISGDITFGVIDRLYEVTEGKPAKVFILIGINDISRNIPDSVIAANHRRIVQYIKMHSPATKIYFHTLLPVNSDFAKHKNHYNKDVHIAAVNAALKVMAKEENITLIDLYPAFLNDQGQMIPGLTYDGLHLTIEGYRKWVSVLKDYKAL